MKDFIHSFQSEWLKKKRSLAAWIAVIGAFFTPVIVIIARLVYHDKLAVLYTNNTFWEQLWKNSWESMAIFLLPMGVILSTSLVTQLEYKNNTWKQVHTLPLNMAAIFFSKLAVIITMMLQFFVLFNAGIYLSALLPYLLISGIPYPKEPIPVMMVLKSNMYYFIDCLPIIALQYLLSLKYKNFLVPVGFGFLFLIGTLASLSWQFGYCIPYSYCMLNFLKGDGGMKTAIPGINIHALATGYFAAITAVSYVLFFTKKEKG
jgi:lantibiotic transport system permease protein